MKTIYFNIKTSQGVETVDQFTRGEDAPLNFKEFNAYIREMKNEYRLSGQNVYSSSRPTKHWANS